MAWLNRFFGVEFPKSGLKSRRPPRRAYSSVRRNATAAATASTAPIPARIARSPMMRPIYLLGADEIDETELPEVEDPRKAHQLALEIEANIPAIYRYWAPRRKGAVETVKREEPKVGRNDDCPCNSGKKYKKCCGAE